jgi:hypothetical protein
MHAERVIRGAWLPWIYKSERRRRRRRRDLYLST